jgi:cell division septum initiation protein DivIVA
VALADHDPDLLAQNEQLRTRVEQLELELATLRAQTVQTVANAQETLYWFERWGVDFNALFSRPQVDQLRKVVRALREVYRKALKAKRRILP